MTATQLSALNLSELSAPAVGEAQGRHPAQGDRRDRPTIAPKAWHLNLVSVIVVVTNRRRNLETVLRSLQNTPAYRLEVVVVDDGSTDDTWKWLQRTVTGGVICRNEQPVGFVDAATQGINASVGQYIGVIDLTLPLDGNAELTHGLVPRSYYETIGRYHR